jgi:hypothetical protein
MNDIMSLFFKSKQIVPIDSIVYNVDNFNLWLQDLDNKNPYDINIYLYIDKLSKLHIEKYLKESYGISKPESDKINYLWIKVKNDWSNKLKSKNK